MGVGGMSREDADQDGLADEIPARTPWGIRGKDWSPGRENQNRLRSNDTISSTPDSSVSAFLGVVKIIKDNT